MPLIDFSPSEPSKGHGPKRLRAALGIVVLLGVSVLGTTLASNISLNNGANVEFGQGVAMTTACDDSLVLTPTSTFVNSESEGDFLFTSVSVSDISSACSGKTFKIQAYQNGQSNPLDLYRTEYPGSPETFSEIRIQDLAGTYSLVEAGLLSDDITSTGPDNFTVTFVTAGPPPSVAVTSARDVDRMTIESSGGSLVAYWNFNNASALGDSAGGNFNLLSCGNPASGSGIDGSLGLVLDGSSFLTSSAALGCNPNGSVSIPSALLGDATYSMTAWFKNSGGNSNGGIVGWGTSNGCGKSTNLRFLGSFNGFVNYWYGCDLADYVPNGATFNDDQWHHIVATYDGQERRMYFDGSLFAYDSAPANPDFQDSQFLIGATIADQAFSGTLDNVGIYSVALSDGEVSALYQSHG